MRICNPSIGGRTCATKIVGKFTLVYYCVLACRLPLDEGDDVGVVVMVVMHRGNAQEDARSIFASRSNGILLLQQLIFIWA